MRDGDPARGQITLKSVATSLMASCFTDVFVPE